jgi:hypothetical protein
MLGADLYSGTPAQFLDGRLDEWRVYARALNPAEVQALMTVTPPVASFSGSPLAGPLPLTVTLVNNSVSATGDQWGCGDGTPSAVVSPTHVYSQAGVYTVTLAAGNGTVTDTVSRTNYIEVNAGSPWATFPIAGILDDFNRADGALGSNWKDDTSEYELVSNQMYSEWVCLPNCELDCQRERVVSADVLAVAPGFWQSQCFLS